MKRAIRMGAALGRIMATLGLAPAAARESLLGTFGGHGLEPREARVFLPPGKISADTPVLVALDGQTMEKWLLPGALAELAQSGAKAPLVIAIPSTKARVDEYGLAARTDYKGRGRRAAAFQKMVVEEILPWAAAHYGLELRRERTGVCGASMGGLSAFDLAWRHPDIFGFAGVFSGSLWWRGDDSAVAAQQSSRLAHRQVREAKAAPPVRFWFQAGTRDETDDRDGNGVIDAIQDTTELMDELRARGWRDGKNMTYAQVEGGEHNEATWARVLPDFLRWAFGRQE